MAVPFLLEWKQFMTQQRVESSRMRPAIMESWLRCHRQGVGRAAGGFPRTAVAADLERRLERYERVLSAADPCLQELSRTVRGSGCVVTLSDPEGIVLYAGGDARGLSTAERTGMVVGSDWSEAGMGTNAIGLALVARQSMDVVGAEHYLDRLHPLACAAAPIWGPMGDLLGVIDLTGPWFQHHALTLALVELAARAVGRELGRRLGDPDTLGRILQTMGEATGSPFLLVDAQGTIRCASDWAARLLGGCPETLAGRSLYDLLGIEAAGRLSLTSGGSWEFETPAQVGSDPVRCLLRSHRVEWPEIGGYLVTIERAEKKRTLVQLPAGLTASYTLDSFLGVSPAVLQLKEQARKVAASDLTVLILGETGTGKELLAHAIHAASRRRDGPFVAVNCAAIPESLLESELFGYEPGAFTGASPRGRKGKFQLASGGTLFLDEIGDMPLGMQAALLRVLQDRQIVRVGGSRPIPVDVRIIAATNKDLYRAVAEGTFRQDLLYRLDVLTLRIPPLRERPEDIPVLVEHFARRMRGAPVRFSPSALAALQQYDWPGNVRELENTVAKCLYATEGEWVDLSALPPHLQAAAPASPPGGRQASARATSRPDTPLRPMAEVERAAILAACEKARGNLSQAARLLGISRPTLYRKLRQYGIPSRGDWSQRDP